MHISGFSLLASPVVLKQEFDLSGLQVFVKEGELALEQVLALRLLLLRHRPRGAVVVRFSLDRRKLKLTHLAFGLLIELAGLVGRALVDTEL